MTSALTYSSHSSHPQKVSEREDDRTSRLQLIITERFTSSSVVVSDQYRKRKDEEKEGFRNMQTNFE